ncbi:MAG: alpha/beta hydrolase family protein [Candidatus Acidiferrales bacterium]
MKPSATIITARIKAATARLTVKQGAYRLAEGTVYVGVEGEPPNHPTIQFYDEKTRRTGTLEHGSGQEYRSDGSPPMNFVLDSPVSSVVEKPIIIESGADRLGASLWHTPGAERRATIVLIHGADDEAREMGFLIPYFVSHGLNVVTYDQRGTGESTGNWQYTGPESKADDVVAILRKLEGDPVVDARRIGVWGFSNGGWVAPIVATRFPVAFMILKSAPSETIAENVIYEIGQDLREHDGFTPKQISDALAFEKIMFLALETNSNWDEALDAAKKQPWFPSMRIPPGMTAPPPHRCWTLCAPRWSTIRLQRCSAFVHRLSRYLERLIRTSILPTARRGFARRSIERA